ncbi:hypothetical protein B7463_g5214, partial [Scytalidium lignicola]
MSHPSNRRQNGHAPNPTEFVKLASLAGMDEAGLDIMTSNKCLRTIASSVARKQNVMGKDPPVHFVPDWSSHAIMMSGDLMLLGTLPECPLRVEDRLRTLEARLAEVAANQERRSWTSPGPISRSPALRDKTIEVPPNQLWLSNETLPPWDVITETARNYLLYCDCQPLPLFHASTFLQSLKNRRPEILLSILALALRFNEGFNAHTDIHLLNGYTEDARHIVMKSVTDGDVGLATLQALCLLSLVDFSNGNTRRASIHCSLAMSLAYSAGLASESSIPISRTQQVERSLCFWSLYIIKQLHGPDFGILEFPEEDNFPAYPESASPPKQPGQIAATVPDDQPSRPGPPDEGIFLYAIDMAVLWSKITAYARRRGKPSKLPPWAPDSEYQIIMAKIMDAETKMPSIHRFKPAEFSKRTPEVTDPFLAHCMAVVATICLQESLTDDDVNLREEKRASFMKCLKFVKSFGRHWPHVERMADKLQRLGETVSLSQPVQTPTRNLLIDLGQFWEILEYSTSSETFSRSSNLFGPSLHSISQPNRNCYYTEMAHTSSLPKPSRVDGQDFATPSTPVTVSRQDSSATGVTEGGNSIPVASLLGEESNLQPPQSFLFSNDELAVLAENLFPQRLAEFDTAGEWWNTGNL